MESSANKSKLRPMKIHTTKRLWKTPPFPKVFLHVVVISLAPASAKWQSNLSCPKVNCTPRGIVMLRHLLSTAGWHH